jgi:Holliday junction resolvase
VTTSPHTHYRRGADLERGVAARLVDSGWWVIRAAGSKGPVDLLALKAGRPPRLIQCKTDRRTMRPQEWALLWQLGQHIGGNCYIADRSGPARAPRLYLVLGDRPRGGFMDNYLEPMPWEAA